MDFWARQDEARRRSRRLVVLFVVAVAAVATAVNAVVLAFIALAGGGPPAVPDAHWLLGHPGTVVVTTLLVLGTIGIASLYRTSSLAAGGGGAVARALGASRVRPETTDPLERRLLNVVEEMAIASGLPVPAVYALEQEEGINAFAAGHAPANAAIAVTRGALLHLERQELQGVIGHEFSHVLNGDMRLNVRLMGLLFGLLVIAVAGRTIAARAPRGSGRGRAGGALAAVAAAGFAVMALGHVGVFFGRLIQAAVSRQREFLADASAVQFTRDVAGLRDALVKIGTLQGSRIRHPDAEEVAHMLFATGMTRWFATHPPLEARIRALDPSVDAGDLHLKLEVRPQPLGVVRVVAGESAPRSFSDPAVLARGYVALDATTVPALVGNPGEAEVARARALRASLPAEELARAGTPAGAAALLLGLALDPAAGVRAVQLRAVSAALGDQVAAAAAEEAARLGELPADRRLPLLAESAPALVRLPVATRERLRECLAALARADGRIAIFEFALGALARLYLDEGLAPVRRARPVALRRAVVELQSLFSALADHGHGDAGAKARAYVAGMAPLGLAAVPPFRPVPGWAAAVENALRCLDGLAPADKARLVEGLAATVAFDGRVTREEAELLRAVCARLHCPLPPLVGAA